jgi:hypothetical protein
MWRSSQKRSWKWSAAERPIEFISLQLVEHKSFMSNPLVVIYEDRLRDLVGVKLLLATLARFEPSWRIRLIVPTDVQTDFHSFNANVAVDRRKRQTTGWNVKPAVLIEALCEDDGPVLWLDSDLLLSAPIRSLLAKFDPAHLVIAEEPRGVRNPGSRLRTLAWDLGSGRHIKFGLNSCVVRVSRAHLPLLVAWAELLSDPVYLQAQSRPWHERPPWLMGDQDPLAALLGSDLFASIPIGLLRQGTDIAQCFNEDGFSVAARLSHAFRPLPPIIHAQGAVKPWHAPSPRAVHLELSPYRWAAQPFANVLQPADRDWLVLSSPFAKLLNNLALGDAALAGLAPALWRTLVRKAGRAARLFLKPRAQHNVASSPRTSEGSRP